LTSLTLLDPLIEDYEREHPHCTYKGWVMAGYPVQHVQSAIENWTPEQSFDTLVMTNVLPHCFDAMAVFETVRRVLKPGGILVFHEDPRPLAPLDLYDVGHPLVVTDAIIQEFLGAFETVYRNGSYFIGRKPTTLTGPKGKAWRK
jgi:SAM-dependent methyltransferase